MPYQTKYPETQIHVLSTKQRADPITKSTAGPAYTICTFRVSFQPICTTCMHPTLCWPVFAVAHPPHSNWLAWHVLVPGSAHWFCQTLSNCAIIVLIIIHGIEKWWNNNDEWSSMSLWTSMGIESSHDRTNSPTFQTLRPISSSYFLSESIRTQLHPTINKRTQQVKYL